LAPIDFFYFRDDSTRKIGLQNKAEYELNRSMLFGDDGGPPKSPSPPPPQAPPRAHRAPPVPPAKPEKSRTPSPVQKQHVSEDLLGSILQNSISAENFSDKFSASNCGQLSTPKTTDHFNRVLWKNVVF
jgi:hypothetical protein